ncbi:MAG: hypothetical protein EA420_03735 [Candidatus Competibacteraceae bacterium]|nr:MAG: hypothetical protein EA420_03735 [Candidatus Competibacteraceae bacterium]
MSSDPESSASNLAFTGRLPLTWRELPALPDAAELQHLEQANLNLLHTLFALDIHAGDHSDDPLALTNATELKRLDFKVGLLLGLVGQLLAHQQAMPPEHPLALTADHLRWSAASAPPVGVPLRLELYCNLSYPQPLILHAQVDEMVSDEGEQQIKAHFYPMSPPMHEALERYIFLQHRRSIANLRISRPR